MVENVHPSQEIIRAHLEKARERLHSAEILAREGQYSDAISRTYYAFFDAATAVLLSRGLVARTHQGLAALFIREFVRSGMFEPGVARHLTQAKDAREEADYEAQKTFTKEQVEHAIRAAHEFVAKIEEYLKR